MIIVGGTYREVCFEPEWDNYFGSGLRAATVVLENYQPNSLDYYTCADLNVTHHLEMIEGQYRNFKCHTSNVREHLTFYYTHPLSTPSISPRPDLIDQNANAIAVNGDNVLAFGMMEATVQVHGKNVVYDPQSPLRPVAFSQTGSTADKLVTVVNFGEGARISGMRTIDDIGRYFLTEEKCEAVIIKRGMQGSAIFTTDSQTPHIVPVYPTDRVWSIGSGDVFSALFAVEWFRSNNVIESAEVASKGTAIYCNSQSLTIADTLRDFSTVPLVPSDRTAKQLYLAGPFFTFGQRWIINEVRCAFKGMGIKVFSPLHDVGFGQAQEVATKDLEALRQSDLVFAVLDGFDPGTVFEIGYAVSLGKKLVLFVQNEPATDLKMFEGSDCVLVDDLTTAIYKACWTLLG